MKKIIQNLKGFRDFLPKEAKERAWLKNKIIQIFELWGYDPLETPTLEPLELFTGQIGDDEKLFFKFKDQGGRDVALRYDQTVPTCRVVAQYQNELTFPFKRYQIQSAYRSEKPQKGRYREFLQCDADIFGIKGAIADAEVIALSLDIYRRIGFKNYKVLVNDRSLMKNIPYEAIVAIDKLKKISEEGVIADMVSRGIESKKAKEYFEFVRNLKPNETVQIILEYLKDSGFDEDSYCFEPTLARSFSYSSGPIWEIEIEGTTTLSVLGGERYDSVIKKISNLDIPGTGFGLGFDRTLEAAKIQNLIPNFDTSAKALVTVYSKEYLKNSIETASKIREMGINVEVYPDFNTDLKKQIKYADKKGIKYVIFIGPEEVKEGIVTLKNMKNGEQKKVTINEITL